MKKKGATRVINTISCKTSKASMCNPSNSSCLWFRHTGTARGVGSISAPSVDPEGSCAHLDPEGRGQLHPVDERVGALVGGGVAVPFLHGATTTTTKKKNVNDN